jgi:hypothetical protein
MARLWLLGVMAAVVLGAALRVACLSAEPWLDEIWSWELAQEAGSVAGIFLRLRHDNNHHLNTLWLLYCPGGAAPAVYRLHSLLAGLASIVLAALVARRWGRPDAVFAAFLVAGCYWLVLSSAEARGYALAVLFALLALHSLWHYLDSGSRPALATFWLASMAGFLSHLTFVHAYLGFVLWSLRRWGKGSPPGGQVRGLVVCHGVPALFFAAFYFLSVRGMEVGGGPPAATAEVLARLIGLGLGGPAEGWAVVPWLVLAGVLFALGMALLLREEGDVWLFFAVAVVGSPALFLVRRPPFLFERYFLIPFAFFLLLSGHALGALWRRGAAQPRGRGWQRCLLAVLVLVAVLAGDCARVAEFSRAGRGQFREALAWVARHDSGPVIAVTGNHDFRVQKYVDFYARYLEGTTEVVYLPASELPAGGVRWLLVHQPDDQPEPGEVQSDAAGNAYRLVQAYPSRGRGCWGWFVYRREPDPGGRR